MKCVTCSAPVNIAVIKYWGKRDERLVLPTNSSLSVTLDQGQLSATTSVALSETFSEDRIWLNWVEEPIGPRLAKCIELVRELCREQHGDSGFKGHIHIASVNNFPTAAGLASSAAGYACLVFALANVYSIEGEISKIARQGSGSACRSVYGGFVRWEKGHRDDGSDSIALQVAPASHWADLEVLVCVVSGEKKAVGSTAGMQRSVETSDLLKERAETVVPQRIAEMEAAIAQKDFETFGRLTMKDSNQFHAICLDTYPPIFYLNETSKRLIQMVTQYNRVQGRTKVAYTFDAGPNAVLFALSPDIPQVLDLLLHYFPPQRDNRDYVRGISSIHTPTPLPETLIQEMEVPGSPTPAALQYILHTKVGSGPLCLDPVRSLLDSDGLPSHIASSETSTK